MPLSFPANPARLAYAASPYTDANGQQWLWRQAMLRWEIAPVSGGSAASNAPYDADTWNGVTNVAPSKNAVRDQFEALSVTIVPVLELTTPPVDGLPAVAASSLLSIPGGLPAPGATLTIAGRVYTWRAASTSSASEIIIGDSVASAIYNLYYALNAPSFGTANASVLVTDATGTTVVIQARVAGTVSNGLTVSSSVSQVTCDNLAGGVNATLGTIATALGQLAIVTHSDGTFTEWGCAKVSPSQWLPRTAGILWDETEGEWIRLNRLAGVLDYTVLPNQ